jgi:hypothetical protein
VPALDGAFREAPAADDRVHEQHLLDLAGVVPEDTIDAPPVHVVSEMLCDGRGCQDRQLAQLLARDMGEEVSAGAASVRAQNFRLIQQVDGICECRLACLLDLLGR